MTKGECIPCNTSRCLSCQKLIASATSENIQTKTKFLAKVTMLLTRLSALQNTVFRKVRNSFSHKIEQPRKGYKKSLSYRRMQTFQ